MDIKEFGQGFIREALSLTDKLLDLIPEEKRRVFLLILGGLVFFAICLTVMALAMGLRVAVNPQSMTVNARIPPEELFYPGEPDFLPPLLFEREPHQPWTIEDLEFFWQDPKAGNEEKWREAVKTVIDKLMDGVP